MHAERHARGLGGRVRQREGIKPQDERGDRRDAHGHRLGVGMQDLADHEAGCDPADRPQHANEWKVACRVFDVVKRDGIRERQRRHVAQRVENQDREERPECGQTGHVPHDCAAHEMQHGQQLFGGDEAIRKDTHEKRRHDRRESGRHIGGPDLGAGEVQRAPQVGPHRDEPRPPDEVLEEHHCGELEPGHGSTRILILRKATRNSCSCRPM